MEDGETRSFTAQVELTLRASDGGALRVSVNGVDLGIVGPLGQPWTDTYNFGESEGATPSNGA